MPPRNPPSSQPDNSFQDGTSFDRVHTSPNGNRSIVSKTTRPSFKHDGYGRPVTKNSKVSVTVPVATEQALKPLDSPNHRGPKDQVTPGKWKSKDKIDGKMP